MNFALLRKCIALAFVSVFAVTTLFACGNDDSYDSDYEDDGYSSSSRYDSDDYDHDYDYDRDRDYDRDYDYDDSDYSSDDTLFDESDFIDTEDGTYIALDDDEGNTYYVNTDGSDAYVDEGGDGDLDYYESR